jgi:hypothetical protein
LLYLDRALTRSLSTTQNLVEVWNGAPIPMIRRQLGF